LEGGARDSGSIWVSPPGIARFRDAFETRLIRRPSTGGMRRRRRLWLSLRRSSRGPRQC
jgi:hypothetical protein